MSHAVKCSRCSEKFERGVTLVYRLVIFNFCAPCWRFRRSCNAIMQAVCPDSESKVAAAAAGRRS